MGSGKEGRYWAQKWTYCALSEVLVGDQRRAMETLVAVACRGQKQADSVGRNGHLDAVEVVW